MNILLTGASGLVGSAFAQLAASQGCTVLGTVGQFNGRVVGLSTTIRINLADAAVVRAQLSAIRCDVVVNCAAVAAPAACDADPQTSMALNVTLPNILAEFAQRKGIRLVHVSSEQVYDGSRATPYTAQDVVAPVNRYGRQKLLAETAVMATAGDLAAIVRPPLLLGNSLTGQRSLHEALLFGWRRNEPSRMFIDEYRQPCTASDLAKVLLILCRQRDLCGVFNWGGAELLSRFEIAARIRSLFGLTETHAPIVAIRRVEHPMIAAVRPACLALDISPLSDALRCRPQTLAEQLNQLRKPASVS